MTQPYIIIIIGHSCSGKSTLVKELQKTLLKSYHIGYDKVKWGLSGYHRDTDQEMINSLLDGFLETILKRQINCISEMIIKEKKKYKKIISLADKYSYRTIVVGLECPEDIRLERFRERVERAKADPNSKISVTSESLFLENSDIPIYFPENTKKYDTSLQTTEKIAENIFLSM